MWPSIIFGVQVTLGVLASAICITSLTFCGLLLLRRFGVKQVPKFVYTAAVFAGLVAMTVYRERFFGFVAIQMTTAVLVPLGVEIAVGFQALSFTTIIALFASRSFFTSMRIRYT